MASTGHCVEAATIYERLADRAYAGDRLRAGVQMDLEATRAWLRAERLASAQTRVLHALDALLARGHLPDVVVPVVARIERVMTERGEIEAAADFRDTVRKRLENHEASFDDLMDGSDRQTRRRGRLPDQCPSCYAPLRMDEVTWLESDRAQCSYCGSVVLTE
jgi:hypothetical protein